MELLYGFAYNATPIEALELLKSNECPAIQILLDKPFSKVQLDYAKRIIHDKDINLVIHSKYQFNFCNTYFNSKSFQKFLDSSIYLGNTDIVIHYGKKKDNMNINTSLALIAQNVRSLTNEDLIVFEFSAGQKNEVGSTLEELNSLQEKLDFNMRTCVDTQHIFARGLVSFDDVDDYQTFIDDINDITNLNPEIIHLNDSKVEFGSRVDRHAKPGKGYIWSNSNMNVYDYILEEAKINQTIIIYEN